MECTVGLNEVFRGLPLGVVWNLGGQDRDAGSRNCLPGREGFGNVTERERERETEERERGERERGERETDRGERETERKRDLLVVINKHWWINRIRGTIDHVHWKKNQKHRNQTSGNIYQCKDKSDILSSAIKSLWYYLIYLNVIINMPKHIPLYAIGDFFFTLYFLFLLVQLNDLKNYNKLE